MIERANLKLEDEVLFGRINGEKTLGRITKINSKRVKITTLESRGRSGDIGKTWNVPFDLLFEKGSTPTSRRRTKSPSVLIPHTSQFKKRSVC